jgi:hypothetical protein
VVSGGQDNKLCLWDKAAVRCVDLLGHSGPIAALAAR